ncbi:hypothetical protein [Psychromonas sp. KJ10-2]|uniref:hypothetical protein n=1 Tax=Psychromonas sp. KJ10-2 TaxID=3391822 RepID=UPI0039B48D3C
MTTITSRCPHCQSLNRLPVERIEANPSCGRCKRSYYKALLLKELKRIYPY